MKYPVVELKGWEILLAATAGIMRQVESIQLKRQPAYGVGTTNDWQIHIEGCLGEYALARWLGVRWSGKANPRDPDVGTKTDVRTRSEQHYDLIVHPEDPDDRTFWLLCGRNGTYTIKGYILGLDAKQDKYWKTPPGTNRPPAYFIPAADLKSPYDCSLQL